MKAVRSLGKARGVTLIELMISLAIGLVVVGAVFVSLIGSGSAGRYQAATSQMNQDAQFGLSLLARQVQMAGYISPGQTLGATAIFGCDATVGTVPFVNPLVPGPLSCNAWTAGNTVSALEVVYEADLRTTAPKTVLGKDYPSDCLGDALPAAGTIYVARNRFYLDVSSNSKRRELHCASNTGNEPQPLIENVDHMQLWYGIASPTIPEAVVRYVQAGKDASTPDTVNALGAAEWGNVNSVRICLLMRSAEPILTNEDTLSYLDCDAASKTSADRHLRRAYFTTATVRTKMPIF